MLCRYSLNTGKNCYVNYLFKNIYLVLASTESLLFLRAAISIRYNQKSEVFELCLHSPTLYVNTMPHLHIYVFFVVHGAATINFFANLTQHLIQQSTRNEILGYACDRLSLPSAGILERRTIGTVQYVPAK